MVAALANAGESRRAVTLARTVTHPASYANAIAAVAAGLVNSGQPDQAKSLICTVSIADERVAKRLEATEKISEVAAAMARSGDVERAKELAQTITKPSARARALIAITEALVEGGFQELAKIHAHETEEAINLVSDRSFRARELTRLARKTDLSHASSLIMKALILDHWDITLSALA